jgi:hypothetical protein
VAPCGSAASAPVSRRPSSRAVWRDFRLRPGSRISGRVTDGKTGAPLVGVPIIVTNQQGMQVTDGRSDADGRWVSGSGLAGGSYYAYTSVYFPYRYANEVYDGVTCGQFCTPTAGTAIVVPQDQSVPNIDFTLLPHGRIEGRVTDALTGAPLTIGLLLANAQGMIVSTGGTTANGDYSLRLYDGTYYIGVNGENSTAGLYETVIFPAVRCDSLPSDACIKQGTLLTVNAGEVLRADFAVPRRGASIEGRLRGAAGQSMPDATIHAYDAAGALRGNTRTRADGTYTLWNLQPSSYYIRAEASGHLTTLYPAVACQASCDIRTGTVVVVAKDALVRNVDIRMVGLPGSEVPARRRAAGK